MRTGREINFRLDNRFRDETPFVPFYKLGYGEPYQMYFDLQGWLPVFYTAELATSSLYFPLVLYSNSHRLFICRKLDPFLV